MRDLAGAALLDRIRLVPVPSPVAGAEFDFTIPDGVMWVLFGVGAQLKTSAAVANRLAHLTVTDGANRLQTYPANVLVAASSTILHTWGQGISQLGPLAGEHAVGSLADGLIVMPGQHVVSLTALIDVADQWSQIVLTVRETQLVNGQRVRTRPILGGVEPFTPGPVVRKPGGWDR